MLPGVRLLFALIALLLIAAAPPVAVGPLSECDDESCTPVDLVFLDIADRQARLERIVTIRPSALPLERPLMVRIVAMASAEVRWNGVLIGRNGVPGPNVDAEVPGRFVSTFIVPAGLLLPGTNRLSVRLSAHHLWLPVRRAVHMIEVGPYESQPLPGLAGYLPALLALGALLAGCVYFGAAFASERRRRPLVLAAAAGLASLQLTIEVGRAFIAYSYPMHLARVAAIAVLAAAVSWLLAAYASRRFAPEWRRRVELLIGAAAVASVLLVPWYDIKAMAAILAGSAAVGACALRGLARERRAAAAALAAALAVPILIGWQLTEFLDRAWYLLLAAVFVALVAEQVQSLRRARSERDSETQRAAALAERLARAEREGEPILALKEGTRLHRVAEGDILYLRAADDYCEAVLAGGRVILVTMTLARLLATLPPRFVRTHKSYAVNRAHVTSVAPKPGGGRLLRLSDGRTIPVGRSYAGATLAITARYDHLTR
jgi:DNA-binding LytR/AlgR family response regulator